jgi:hypothetical protein
MSTDDFYAALPPIRSFAGAFDDAVYTPVPDDWIIAVTDVVDSTVAINEGRDKDTTIAGAVRMVAISNHLGHMRFPYIFCGDGMAFFRRVATGVMSWRSSRIPVTPRRSSSAWILGPGSSVTDDRARSLSDLEEVARLLGTFFDDPGDAHPLTVELQRTRGAAARSEARIHNGTAGGVRYILRMLRIWIEVSAVRVALALHIPLRGDGKNLSRVAEDNIEN